MSGEGPARLPTGGQVALELNQAPQRDIDICQATPFRRTEPRWDLRQRISATSRMTDAAARKVARQELANNIVPVWAKGIEALIGEGPFVGGARPAVADIKIHVLARALSNGSFDDIPTTVLDRFARIGAVASGVANHPAVEAWSASKS